MSEITNAYLDFDASECVDTQTWSLYTLQGTAQYCNTLHHTAIVLETHGTTLQHPAPPCTVLQHAAPRCTTTRCTTLQHAESEVK